MADKLKESPDSWPFVNPVSSKDVPDYHKIVTNPMDLQQIREVRLKLKEAVVPSVFSFVFKIN